jgi:7-alpha-hydroxysteroid dehydrogenase
VSTAHALTHAAVPLLLEDRAVDGPAAAVVNISSVMGRVSGRGYLAYGTAKAALAHYTELAARDLAPRIRVNAIGVGSVATSALELVLGDETMRTTMEETTPLRRIGAPEDIAATVLFLASDAAAYVTGKVVGADGGLDQPNLDLGFPDL